MTRRGPRGDLSAQRILEAAETLVRDRGSVGQVSLRMLASELGVTANSVYTYFPSLAAIMHDLADQRLGQLRAEDLLSSPDSAATWCAHCALLELHSRIEALKADPTTVPLLQAQPVLGENSFRLSETVMTLCAGANLPPRDCHDLIMGWFYGSAILVAEGWTSGTDEKRTRAQWTDRFPRIATRTDPDPRAQVEAILRGLGIEHIASENNLGQQTPAASLKVRGGVR